MKEKQLAITFATMAAATLMLVSCGKKDGNSAASGYVQTIDVAMPEQDSIVVREGYPGYLKARQSVDVVSRVDGYITGQHFKEGQHVEKGQLLYTIESSNYADQVEQAKAQLATAEATYEYNSRNYQALRKALESDAVSQLEVVQAESAMNESKASIEQARAALRSAQTTLSYCSIRAPFAGFISASNFDVGQYTAGAAAPQKLATLYNDDDLSVVFSINDDQYLKMIDSRDAGILDFDSIPVTFNDTLPHSYYGRLNYLAPDIDRSTGTMEMRVKVDNPYGELKSGMFATVNMPMSVLPHAILIKDASIGTDQLGKYIYVVNDSNRIVYTPVEVGPTVRDTLRVVYKGVTPDSRYVTKALLKVRDGMEVKPNLVK